MDFGTQIIERSLEILKANFPQLKRDCDSEAMGYYYTATGVLFSLLRTLKIPKPLRPELIKRLETIREEFSAKKGYVEFIENELGRIAKAWEPVPGMISRLEEERIKLRAQGEEAVHEATSNRSLEGWYNWYVRTEPGLVEEAEGTCIWYSLHTGEFEIGNGIPAMQRLQYRLGDDDRNYPIVSRQIGSVGTVAEA